jgi:hypothetical protein
MSNRTRSESSAECHREAIVTAPYSSSRKETRTVDFHSIGVLVCCANLRFLGGWDCRGRGRGMSGEVNEWKCPLPLHRGCRSSGGEQLAFTALVRRSEVTLDEKAALCKSLLMRLRMTFSAGCLQCRPAEASCCYELLRQTLDV